MRALWGPGIWALAFAAIYALQGAGCAADWPAAQHRGVLGLVWGLALLAGLWLLRRAPKSPGSFAQIVRAGDRIGLVATLFTLFPLLILRLCAAEPL